MRASHARPRRCSHSARSRNSMRCSRKTRRPSGSPRPAASRLLTAAEARRAAGEDDAAGWAEVVEAFRKLEEPYTLAYALMRHADALIMERDTGAATDPLREAHRVTEALGERPLRAEIEALAQRSRISLEEAVDTAADPLEMRGIDSPRAGGAVAAYRRRHQPRDRGRARDQREDGERPRFTHPRQARSPQSRGGRVDRPPAGTEKRRLRQRARKIRRQIRPSPDGS